MKNRINYIAWLLGLTFIFAACDKTEPDFFDKDANGAYFDYGYAADFDKVVNFSEHIVGTPDVITVNLKVRLLGYIMNEERSLAIKTKEIEGYEPADVTIEKVVFANKEYEKDVEVKVKRPAAEDVMYGICIYLDGSGDIGTGIEGKSEINLYVTEAYEKPGVWYSHIDTYLGDWSKEKQIFLANHTGNDHFYSALYDSNLGMHNFDMIKNLNISAVNALLAQEPAEPIIVELPILKESEYPAYTKPYFWDEYKEYLGAFSASKFCRITTMLGGSNTKDVAALYASDAALQTMQEQAGELHKKDVFDMLNEYYNIALMGYPISQYKDIFWVEIKNNITYTMRIPYWWEDNKGYGPGAIVKRYFGEYNADKYQFMLKTMLREDGAENFIAESIFPFTYDKENDTYAWDNSPFGTKQLAGEERLKECYRIIKAANDKRPASRKFDIPEVEID